MYGLAAIEQANGWAMAGAGACIVLTGLSVLSFLISLIPRLTSLFEEKKQSLEIVKETAATPSEKKPRECFPDGVKEASEVFIEETKDLGEAFTLIDLHRRSKKIGVVDPHLTIRRFREAGILISSGEGRFSWQPISE